MKTYSLLPKSERHNIVRAVLDFLEKLPKDYFFESREELFGSILRSEEVCQYTREHEPEQWLTKNIGLLNSIQHLSNLPYIQWEVEEVCLKLYILVTYSILKEIVYDSFVEGVINKKDAVNTLFKLCYERMY